MASQKLYNVSRLGWFIEYNINSECRWGEIDVAVQSQK